MMRTQSSKHVQAWNKLIVKQKFCASSWSITKINYSVAKSVNIAQQTAGWKRTPLHWQYPCVTQYHKIVYFDTWKNIYELTHKVRIKQIFMKNLMQAIGMFMEILTPQWKTVDFKFLDTWQYGFVKP